MAVDVAILGAGFSKAISDEMPMTGELGADALALLRAKGFSDLPAHAFTGPRLEAWLSRLAEPQPDLSAAKNLSNQSLFLSVSEALRDVILERQARVHQGEVPWWLRKLLGALHAVRATVVTFNYDTLIETAVSRIGLWDEDAKKVAPEWLLRGMPPTRRHVSGLSAGVQQSDTLRYLKLHGSIDTFWIPQDVSGASIGRYQLAGQWGAPRIASDDERRQLLPGTEPYLVPPAAAKSPFYSNPLARELWRATAEALSAAERVAIVGYSLPMTDLVTSGMLTDALGGSASEVVVVNPDPSPIRARLEELGVDRSRVSEVGSVQEWVAALEREFIPSLDAPNSKDLRLAVGWKGQPRWAIDRVLGTSAGTAHVLVGTRDWATAAVRRRDLDAGGASAERVQIHYPSGETAMVARAYPLGDAGRETHLVLLPTALPSHEFKS